MSSRDRQALGIIPARFASVRFPGKVLAPLCGKPMIQHVYERLAAASTVGDVVVATDSREVAEAVECFGGRVIKQSRSFATGTDRVAAAARDRPEDLIVDLQADEPLVDPVDIDRAVLRLAADESIDITTLAFEACDEAGFLSRDVVKVVANRNGHALYFSRSPVPHAERVSGIKPLYLGHVGIYCYRRAALMMLARCRRSDLEMRESLEQLRALEQGMTVGVVLAGRATVSVDRPDDLQEAERRLQRA